MTTSSPLVKSASHIDAKDIVSAASTVPSTSQLNVGDTDVQKYKVASLQAPAEVGERRPTSPVDKLKGAFGRRSTSPNSKAGSGSPERKPLPSPVQAARQQDGDTTKRRGSVAARIGAIFPDRAASPQQMEKPKPRIPTITTSSERPHTPPTTAANAAPAIVNTPPTPTETSSPTFNGRSPIQNNPNIVTSPSGNMISHRRTRSGTNGSGNHPLMPSKLSSMQSAPLTPTPENGAITGGSQQQQSGFFSSVFSAAQNAANTLSNTITSTNLPGQNRIRSGTQDGGEPITKPMDGVEVESAEDARIRSDSEAKEPAVKTLGMGDLSLDQLGISETPQSNVTPVTANFSEAYIPRGRSATVGAADDFDRSYQVPGTAVISDKGEATNNVAVMDDTPMSRTFSAGTYETSIAGAGDASPRNGSVLDGKTGRSNSIRSALGAPRRHRGSSVATNTTVGGGLKASLPGGVAAGTTPKVTGFAVASKKRNRDFHQLFRSVPDDDYLIEDYSCALQREILAHGRLYVSEGHLCFSSNIFGWVTTLVMSFDEIVSVEKRNTALLFKNGLIISTLHSKNVFASFTSRDSTYDLIVGIWKLGHPSLRSSLNGVRLEETGGGDKTEKDDPSESGSDSDPASGDEEVYDEDEEYDEEGSLLEEGSFTASEPLEKTTTTNRKVSAMTTKTTATSATKKDDATGAPAEKDYPGPPTHAPTECADGESHYEKVIADEVINAPLGKIYNLMFGPASTVWLSNWLTNDMKCLELTMEEKRGLTKDNVTRLYSYIKPLYASIGPKSTKCITTETLDMLDLDKAVSVTVSTQTPDVPSGNVFLTKTKYCLTWAEGGGTRIQMNCTIEWTGKSWLKGKPLYITLEK